MIRPTLAILCLLQTFLAAHALAQEMDGAPRGTQTIPFTITAIDGDFLEPIEVGKREFGDFAEVVIALRVRGFSLDFAAGLDRIEQAFETSYYDPAWHAAEPESQPTFVWWESDSTTSTHIMKIQTRNQAFLTWQHKATVVYINYLGQRSELQISF